MKQLQYLTLRIANSDGLLPSENLYLFSILGEYLDGTRLVLDQQELLKRCTLGYGLFYIAMFPAKKTLPDGRNAHLIIESSDWWLEKIKARWELMAAEVFKNGDLGTLMVYVKRIER